MKDLSVHNTVKKGFKNVNCSTVWLPNLKYNIVLHSARKSLYKTEPNLPNDVKYCDTIVTHCKLCHHASQRQLSTVITTQRVNNESSNETVAPIVGAVVGLFFTVVDLLFGITDHHLSPFLTQKSTFYTTTATNNGTRCGINRCATNNLLLNLL